MKRFNNIYFFIFIICLLISSCNKNEDTIVLEGGEYYIYYSNADGTTLIQDAFKPSSDLDDNKIAKEMINKLSMNSKEVDKIKTIPDDVKVKVSIVDNIANVTFNNLIASASEVDKVLCRASIVLTLIQLDSINSVKFYVGDSAMVDANGQELGNLKANDFVDNSSKLITMFERAEIILYYANEDGTMLKPYTFESVLSNNISIEQFVIDKLLTGISKSGYYPTLDPQIDLLSVNTKDGICYVNFGSNFLDNAIGVKDDITIYSVTNSLCELPNVSKVQFLINGESDEVYHSNISLNEPFIRNLDHVEK